MHRENEYEWKYIGVWLDMLPETICNKVKCMIQNCEPKTIFVIHGQYKNPLEMVQTSLLIRNSIPAVIDVNDKRQIEKRVAKIKDLENNRRLFIEGIMNGKSLCAFGVTVYLNDTSEFKYLRFN